jgi:hypothetical protein
VSKGWTLATLKEHIESRIEAVRDNAALALTASEKAILKAETAADKRAEASNEIRAAMLDQQRNFADKESTERRLKLLEDADIASRGKSAGVGMIAAIIVGAIGVLGIVFTIVFAGLGG